MLALVKELLRRGHEVDWILHAQDDVEVRRVRTRLREEGANLVDVAGMDRHIPATEVRAAMARDLVAYARLGIRYGHPFYPPDSILNQQVTGLMDYLTERQPTLLLTEAVCAAKIAVMRLEWPWVFVPAGAAAWRRSGITRLGDALPGMSRSGRLVLNMVDRLGLYSPRKHQSAVLEATEEVPERSPFLNLVGSLAEWEQVPAWEPHTHFVGPLLYRYTTPMPDWWEEIRHEPCIFVSPGTSVREPRFIQTAIDCLSPLGLPVVIATGYQHEPDEFRIGSSNVFIAQWLDLEEVLGNARAAVTVGGWTSALTCLLCGVPSLIVPFIIDQVWAGERVEQLGAGLSLPWDDYTPTSLLTSVQRLLTDQTLHAGAHAASARLRQLPGASGAATLVEQLLKATN